MSGGLLPGMGATLAATGNEAPAQPTFTGPLVTITERAAAKASSLLADKGHADGLLRVFVVGGGCSGFQYDIRLDDSAGEDDLVLEKDGQKVMIDAVSLPFLSNAVIDFSEELIGARFVIENPNATSSCGCGTSFSL